MVRWSRRTASAALAAATALSLVAPAASASSPAAVPAAADAAAWLAGQLVDGERIEVTFDFGEGPQTFADQGLTADTVLALAGAGVGAPRIAAATAWLEDEAGAYTGVAFDEVYVGPVAKLLVVADATGLDPRDVGGIDLVATLAGREQPSGRFTDASEWGDFSSGISQSLAILGLHRTAGVEPSAAAVDYLADQACDDGGFPQQLDPATCIGDVDTTAFAVQALLAAGGTDTAAAVAWLEDQQGADGGFGSAEAGPNANSTGLAATALAVAGATDAVQAAQAFLLDLQDGCADPDPGAIRYDAARSGDPVRATAQAVLGLVGIGLADIDAAGAADGVPTLDCPYRFPDVDYSSTHAQAIDRLAREGILSGRADGTFRPAGSLTRGQLAAVVSRAAGLEPTTGDRFDDVAGHTHEGAIYALAEAQIVDGFADGSFRPAAPVSRGQAAAILARWLELDPVDEDAFTDVAGTAHRRPINALAEVGIARGTTDGRYLPGATIRRDQAASLLVRTLDVLASSDADA